MAKAMDSRRNTDIDIEGMVDVGVDPVKAALIAVVAIGAFCIVWRICFPGGPAYRKKQILTGNELEFLGRLERALPELRILPQVSMAAMIEPTTRNSKLWQKHFWHVSQKRVDFTVCNRRMQVIALIELDDAMHDVSRDRERDRCTASAGITTLRFQSKHKPSVQEIRSQVLALMDLSHITKESGYAPTV